MTPLLDVLRASPGKLASELDGQGLQVAALSRTSRPHVVTTSEVTICSPFPPHQDHLGRAGAHFVGLNAKKLGFQVDGRAAEEHTLDNWRRLREDVYRRVGIAPDRIC